MLLHITEKRWGQNRVTGMRTERVTGREVFPFVQGMTITAGMGKRNFVIEQVTEESVTVRAASRDPRLERTLTLIPGETSTYAPTSFGAGYTYTLKYTREDKENG